MIYIQKIKAGQTLRILDESRFEVVWSADGWKTTQVTGCHPLGSAGFSADLSTGSNAESGGLLLTLHWPEQGRWLGYNVEVTIERDGFLDTQSLHHYEAKRVAE